MVCRAEEPVALAEPVQALGAARFTWEFAVSRSAADAGQCRRVARQGRLLGETDLDTIVARLDLFDLVVVQPISLNTLAKAALGIQDSLPSRVIAAALAAGKPLFLDESCLLQATERLHPHLNKLYRRYWSDLIGGPVAAFTPDQLPDSLQNWLKRRRDVTRSALESRSGRQVVTRDDVREAWQAMTPLTVPQGSLITDLAREEAAALGVVIRFA